MKLDIKNTVEQMNRFNEEFDKRKRKKRFAEYLEEAYEKNKYQKQKELKDNESKQSD